MLVRLGQGRSNPQIAAELHVSRKTVSSHLEHIYAKLGVKTRTEAALFAMRHGLIRMAANPGPDEKIGQLPDSLPPMDPYNGSMTTTADNHSTAAAPQFALAGSFLEGLAAQDFTKLSGALAPGVRLRALLPPGLMEWTGAEATSAARPCRMQNGLICALPLPVICGPSACPAIGVSGVGGGE